MKLLLHICCGPCASATVEAWRQDGVRPSGTFFNPNIHPFQEHERRYRTLRRYATEIELPLIGEPHYDVVAWLRLVSGREEKGVRCRICIAQRLGHTAELAAREGFDAFSTSLSISPWQEHEIIAEEGAKAGAAAGVEFIYRDLRPRYRRSIELSKEVELYRQKYCGCIYSEAEAEQERAARKKGGRRC